LLAARWRKLCWNIPFNGIAVTAGGVTTDRITGDPELRAAAIASMREVIASGNADLADRTETARLDGDAIVDEMMTMTDAMEAYRPSTMIDFVEGQPMEVDAIFEAPLARAQQLGVPTPLMALMTAQLRALDRDRDRASRNG
jgi:2-dehydropantoate 2-reductase